MSPELEVPEHPRSAIFSGPNAARQMSDWLMNWVGPNRSSLLHSLREASLFDRAVTDAGGLTSFSATRRETRVYEHDAYPYDSSRTYLEDRDAIAWAITTGFAEKMWLTFPRSADPRHRDFFAKLDEVQFLQSMMDAEAMARRDGTAYVYIRASGRPDEPLQRGDVIHGFSPIGQWQIKTHNIERHRGNDPILMRHGMEKVVVETNAKDEPHFTDVHGHRIIRLTRNRGRGYLWPSYDDLWYFKDILFSLRMSQYAGNPIKMEVDAKWLEMVGEDLTEPEMADLKKDAEDQTAKIQSGHKSSYEPIKGILISRVGASGLDDPMPVLHALASRLALVSGISSNRLLASSKGSVQVTDEDRIDEMTTIYERQLVDARDVYTHLLLLARMTNMVPARTPTLPLDVKWPYVRILNPREVAYVKKSNVSILKTALDAGHWPDEEIMEGFRPVTEPMDPLLTLPKQAPFDSQLEEKSKLKQQEAAANPGGAELFDADGGDEMYDQRGRSRPPIVPIPRKKEEDP